MLSLAFGRSESAATRTRVSPRDERYRTKTFSPSGATAHRYALSNPGSATSLDLQPSALQSMRPTVELALSPLNQAMLPPFALQTSSDSPERSYGMVASAGFDQLPPWYDMNVTAVLPSPPVALALP